MRTIALETASHIGLRNFAKEMCVCVCVCVCEPSAYLFFVKGVHAIMKRMSGDCKDLIRPTPMAEACC